MNLTDTQVIRKIHFVPTFRSSFLSLLENFWKKHKDLNSKYQLSVVKSIFWVLTDYDRLSNRSDFRQTQIWLGIVPASSLYECNMHAQLYTNVYHAPMPFINTIYLLQTSSEIFRTETELYWKLTKKMFLKWTSKFLFYAVIVNKHSILYPLSRKKKTELQQHSWKQGTIKTLSYTDPIAL